MYRLALILPAMLVGGGCIPPERRTRDLAALERAALHTFSERELDAYLRHLQRAMPRPIERVVHLGRKSIGQPCKLGALGEFPFELYDADPLYDLSAGDCLTFVEQTFAMALAGDWPSFIRMLQRLRYRDMIVGILTRNHFIEADWNPNNSRLFEEVTGQLGGEILQYTLTVDRNAFLGGLGVGDHAARVAAANAAFGATLQPVTCQQGYVAVSQLPVVAGRLREGDIIELIRNSSGSLCVGHMGILVRGPRGRLMLLHSGRPAVQEVPLEDYLRAHLAFVGFKVLRLREEHPAPGAQ